MKGRRSKPLSGAGALPLSLPVEAIAPIAPLPPGAGLRSTLLEGQRVDYTLRRSRRRTLGFQIDERGLTVSAPSWYPLRELDAALQEKAGWILAKLVEWREYQQRRERLAIRWADGESLRYLGRVLRMNLCSRTDGVVRDGAALRIGLPPGAGSHQMRDRVHAWLQAEATRIFGERLPIFCERLGRMPTRWGLSSARTRWGSCTADGVIRLNWRLVHFPLELIDYVIAHEVAHLKELNHSAEFWSTVGELMPGYREARERLRALHEEGAAL
jgi:predicted metal-dependent hydrolase